MVGLRFTTVQCHYSANKPYCITVLPRFWHHILPIRRHYRFTAESHSSHPFHKDNYLSQWKPRRHCTIFFYRFITFTSLYWPRIPISSSLYPRHHTYGAWTVPSPGNTRRSHYTPRLRCRVCAPCVKRYGNTSTNWLVGNSTQLHSHLDSIKFRQHHYLFLFFSPFHWSFSFLYQITHSIKFNPLKEIINKAIINRI